MRKKRVEKAIRASRGRPCLLARNSRDRGTRRRRNRNGRRIDGDRWEGRVVKQGKGTSVPGEKLKETSGDNVRWCVGDRIRRRL